MTGPTLKGQRLAALFLLGCLLFNYPVLSLFAQNALVFGIPLIYVYLFSAWTALVCLMALIVERRDP